MKKEGLKVIAKNFIGSTANWNKINPRLPRSVWGMEETTDGKLFLKIGDGKTRWKKLKYFEVDSIHGLRELIQERDGNLSEILEHLASLQEGLDTEIQERQTGDEDLAESVTELETAITENKEAADNHLIIIDDQIDTLKQILDGTKSIKLTGDFLTRVINGTTPVAKNLFAPLTVFEARRTIIHDANGTIGIYIEDVDASAIIVETLTTSQIAPSIPTGLGSVQRFADLPQTITEAAARGWHTPRIDDYAYVQRDENYADQRMVWHVVTVDEDGNMTWGNPITSMEGDFQIQTTSEDAGKVLTGGASPGTYGESLAIDTDPTEGSNNLVQSGGLFAWFGGVRLMLKTVNKNIIGAINELFDGKLDKSHIEDEGSHEITVTDEESTELKEAGKDTVKNWIQSFRKNIKSIFLILETMKNQLFNKADLVNGRVPPEQLPPVSDFIPVSTNASLAGTGSPDNPLRFVPLSGEIIYSTNANLVSALQTRFGSVWHRAESSDGTNSVRSGIFPESDNGNITLFPGITLLTGSVVHITVCCSKARCDNQTGSIRLFSNTRNIQTITLSGAASGLFNFNAITLQANEILQIEFNLLNRPSAEGCTVNWFATAVKGVAIYFYHR
ncbi:MAG: hypothetical protein LBU88_00360 [Treponema sp.]|jgi:hypothetical protein|nr:hypothetical protein [Treponema sp.]